LQALLATPHDVTAHDVTRPANAPFLSSRCAGICRWRFGQPPEKLHFYWVVQHNEVDAFQWFLHLITELEHEHFKQKAGAGTDAARKDWNKYYAEIHMFVTRAPGSPVDVPPMVSAPKFIPPTEEHPPTFAVTDLYGAMRNPTVSSRKLRETMQSVAAAGKRPPNNLQDVWVWNGRPDWDQIFTQMKDQAIDPDIGVFVSFAAVLTQTHLF